MIAWMPGQSTGFHDHGGSSGAYCVVNGSLQERRPGEEARVIAAGEVQAFGPTQVHDVRNTSAAPAISLHAYSPALTEMTHYAVEEGELRPVDIRPRIEASNKCAGIRPPWHPVSTPLRKRPAADPGPRGVARRSNTSVFA